VSKTDDLPSKTCGGCVHSLIPEPRMSNHKQPRILQDYPGECRFVLKMPMCEHRGMARCCVADAGRY